MREIGAILLALCGLSILYILLIVPLSTCVKPDSLYQQTECVSIKGTSEQFIVAQKYWCLDSPFGLDGHYLYKIVHITDPPFKLLLNEKYLERIECP